MYIHIWIKENIIIYIYTGIIHQKKEITKTNHFVWVHGECLSYNVLTKSKEINKKQN